MPDPQTTREDEIALRLASAFLRISEAPLIANIEGLSYSKEGIADRLNNLADELKEKRNA